jgi:DNA-binding winged helix-turn-helix (wHTH) protein
VLEYLIRHRDRVVSTDELLEHLWPHQFIADGTLNACLMAVRKAIGDSGQGQRRIQTLHGCGYRFVAAVEEQEHILPDGTTTTAAYAMPGSAGQTQEPGALLAASEPPQTTHETPSVPPSPRGASPSPALHIPDQEHKQVTVLCGGLTEVAALATRLGAEAMHHRMQAFLARVQTTVERYGAA